MTKLLAVGVGALGFLATPLLVLLAVIGTVGANIACPPGALSAATGAAAVGLRAGAPVPARALAWIAATHQACPALPVVWIAAIMAQESSFNPAAYADDVNGGTWGLFQLNATEWAHTYHHPWEADRNHDGIPDIDDPLIHARVAGTYFCARLTGVRRIRRQHPTWASTRQLSELQALALAHMSGENTLAYYPALGPLTARYLTLLNQRTAAWSAPTSGSALPQPAISACQEVPPAGSMAAAALAWALSHVGDAYVAGAHGPRAWDCSTFTYQAYKDAGLEWPMQISYGQYQDRTHVLLIPLTQAQPGDLIFFDTHAGNSWYNPITHVGIIINPTAGTMVNAESPATGVTISNYKTEPYYQSHPPVGAPGPGGAPTPGTPPVAGRVYQGDGLPRWTMEPRP